MLRITRDGTGAFAIAKNLQQLAVDESKPSANGIPEEIADFSSMITISTDEKVIGTTPGEGAWGRDNCLKEPEEEPEIVSVPQISQEMLDNLYGGIERSSITPTTFRSRTLDSINEQYLRAMVLAATKKAENKEREVDQVQVRERENKLVELKALFEGAVEQQGEFSPLDKSFSELEKRLSDKYKVLSNYEAQLTAFQRLIISHPGLLLLFRDIYQANDHSVEYIGINNILDPDVTSGLKKICENETNARSGASEAKSGKSSGKKSKTPEVSSSNLHPLEVFVIKEAIRDFERGKKTILVDIFARNQDGTLKQESGGYLETHTIVLFKQLVDGLTQILIIDPSNSCYSRHLADSVNQANILSPEYNNFEILAPSREFVVYKPKKDNIGPAPYQYRDCTDIAVKIAFGVSRIDKIDIGKIQSLPVVLEVSNQIYEKEDLGGIEHGLFFSAEEAIARIRQSSENVVRGKINCLTIKFKHQINSVKEYTRDNHLGEEVRQEIIDAFCKNYTPEQYAEAIVECMDLYHKLEANSISILGVCDEG